MKSEKDAKILKALKKLEKRLEYLRKRCSNKSIFEVIWLATRYKKPDIFLYELRIHDKNSTDRIHLWKVSTDYNYLIELYDLYMKDI